MPFTIPGESDLCDTMKDLPSQARDKKIPDFLQALEKPDLAHPGTIAHLRLKLEKLEPPARVTLGAWPNEKAARAEQEGRRPLDALGCAAAADEVARSRRLGHHDLLAGANPLSPGAKREVGFEYGLWNLASQGSRLATIVDGAFRPDGELTVVAYVNRSEPEQGTRASR